jgi:serine/threonine-protein kinase RsbW
MVSLRGNGVTQSLHLELTSDPANLATARKAVEALARGCGFDDASWGELGLCVNEAMANVIRHAYGEAANRPVHVDASFDGDTIHIQLRDWGNGINPLELAQPAPDPLRPGGLGLICLRKCLDSVEFFPQPDGMLLKMSRRLRHANQPAARSAG